MLLKDWRQKADVNRKIILVKKEKKMYKYFIYRIYSYYLKRNDNVPVFTTILVITYCLSFILCTIFVIAMKIFPILENFFNLENYPIYTGALLVLFFFFNYLVLYNKERWKLYVEKFETETKEQRAKGTLFILLCLIGAPIVLFIVMIALMGL